MIDLYYIFGTIGQNSLAVSLTTKILMFSPNSWTSENSIEIVDTSMKKSDFELSVCSFVLTNGHYSRLFIGAFYLYVSDLRYY